MNLNQANGEPMVLGVRAVDLTGKRFGKLTVLSIYGRTVDKKLLWLCKCDCGKEKIVRAASLQSGDTKSCGCYYYETRKDAISKIAGEKSHFYKHGLCYSRINGIYRKIKGRCYDKSNPAYSNYGGRGIVMCDEWKNDFLAFYEWSMKNGYSDELTIDRINNNRGYSPDNCRWVNQNIQQNNRRNNIRIRHNGEEHTLSEWANIIGVTKSTIYHRYERHWPIEKMLDGFGSTGR